MPTCKQCSQPSKESTTQYSARIMKGFDTPFFCWHCRRIKRYEENPEIARELERKKELRRQKTIAKKEWKDQMIQFCRNAKHDPNVKAHAIVIKEHETKLRKRKNGTRRHRLGAYVIPFEEKEKIKIFYQNTPKGYHVDHIIPLYKGGTHCLENLQYLPARENLWKQASIPKELIHRLAEGEGVSISFLMRKFKMSYENAEKLLKLL